MRARILNTFGYGDRLDDLVTHLHAETIPAAKAQAGYRGMLVLGDRNTQHVMIVTLWHRAVEERASAHSAFLEKQLRDATPFIGFRATHEALDVLLSEWPADQTPEGAPSLPSPLTAREGDKQ
jgi:hypothetical protein